MDASNTILNIFKFITMVSLKYILNLPFFGQFFTTPANCWMVNCMLYNVESTFISLEI